MEEKTCPQCFKLIDGKSRIYKDEICGHSKCKMCLLEEEDDCKQCSGQGVDDHNYSNDVQQLVPAGYDIVHIETGEESKYEMLSERFDESQEGKVQYIEEEYLETQSETDFSNEASVRPDFIKTESEKELDKDTKEIIPKKIRSQVPAFIESIKVTNGETGQSEDRYRCNICQKIFKSSHQIRYHQYCDESLEKPYKCDQCSADYRTSYQLKQHQQLHLNMYYECSECSRKFSHDASAKKHYKKHFLTAPPPKKPITKGVYPCNICDKIFARKDYLKKHMICHDEKKRFKCDRCDRIYARNNALKFHILTAHTERQDFDCKCGKTFSTMQSLARHQIIHSATKHLKCLVCGLKSSRKDNLFRHIRTFHPNTDPKTNIAVDDSIDDDVDHERIEETTTTVLRSQEASLRKNVIVMKKPNEEEVIRTELKPQNDNKIHILKEEKITPEAIVEKLSTSTSDTSYAIPTSVQSLKNIDIYRKILLPMPEDQQHEESDGDIEEYVIS